MDWIMARTKADVVFHSAAYKHVPMMEENAVAAIENNFFGTDNLIFAAKKHNVKRFVHMTTDKAVEPVSIYGVSKFLCDLLVLEAAKEAVSRSEGSPSSFIVVRFGNVLGSRGSIMPLFQKQIEKGGPLTITHPDVCRWFMTIPEACSLVLKAGGVGENGDLYLLDMGEPVKIRDLAEQMIRFHGLEPEQDIGIEYIGLRPGERLNEKLLWDSEISDKTGFDRILKVRRDESLNININTMKEKFSPIFQLDLGQFEKFRNNALLRNILRQHIPSYASIG